MHKDEILDRMRSGKMSRRRFNQLLAAAGVGFAAMPVTQRAARADEEAILFTWSGYDVPEAHPGYDAKYGAPPDMPLFSDEEEAFQKLLSEGGDSFSQPAPAAANYGSGFNGGMLIGGRR